MTFYQQGDVLIDRCGSIPETAKRKADNYVAEGEETGHYHAVEGAGTAVFEDGKQMFVDAPTGATLTHQEHGDIELPAGTYRSRIVQEYDHFAEEARDVID